MAEVFAELHRVTRPGGFVAFEVGEVRRGKLRLDEVVLPLGLAAGFRAHLAKPAELERIESVLQGLIGAGGAGQAAQLA